MRSAILALLAAGSLTACTGNPVAEQARAETRHDPVRADTMLAVGFQPGTGRLDLGQINELRAMVTAGQHAQRDEFVVVTDGSGGTLQQLRAQQVRQSLSSAGARWVGTSVEPAMAMGPDQVVVVRSEYRLGTNNCPNYNPSSIGNPNESQMGGYGCADAYNMGQMLARPRDAAVGRAPGPAEAWVNADAVQRYREGRVRTASPGGSAGGGGAGGIGGGAAGGGATTGTGS
jgi:type IV pilus biogenesis protein CpaD/CtpE